MNLTIWPDRPVWVDLVIALLVGAVGEILLVIGFGGAGGAFEPIRGLLMPALMGSTAALVTRRGAAIVGLLVGVILGYQAAGLLGAPIAAGDLIPPSLAAGAAGLGFAATFGIRTASATPAMFQPPSPLDRERMAIELSQQLRSIDPAAPGAFERSVALLRQVNEQLQMYGPFSPWQAGASDAGLSKPSSELIRVQSELIEAARLSAIAAGARRVTITSNQMGLDVQAVFGDPIVGEPAESEHDLRPIG